MTPEAQRIAIAEACGLDVKMCPIHRQRNCCGRPRIPDYLGSLDAMHEAEKVLTDERRSLFGQHLFCLVFNGLLMQPHEDCSAPCYEINGAMAFALATATAPQRAEAFLRTLNLWTE